MIEKKVLDNAIGKNVKIILKTNEFLRGKITRVFDSSIEIKFERMGTNTLIDIQDISSIQIFENGGG